MTGEPYPPRPYASAPAAEISGSIRNGIWRVIEIALVERCTAPVCSIALMTSCRCVLSRATTRHEDVAVARDAVRLEHLGHAREPRDRLVQAALDDLQRDERDHGIAHPGGLELRAEPGDHAAPDELVQPRLHRPARDAEPPRDLHHADARVRAQHQQQPGIEPVDLLGQLATLRRRGRRDRRGARRAGAAGIRSTTSAAIPHSTPLARKTGR